MATLTTVTQQMIEFNRQEIMDILTTNDMAYHIRIYSEQLKFDAQLVEKILNFIDYAFWITNRGQLMIRESQSADFYLEKVGAKFRVNFSVESYNHNGKVI